MYTVLGAIFLVVAFGAILVADDSSATSFSLECEDKDFGKGGSVRFIFTASDLDTDKYKQYEVFLEDSDGKSVGSVTPSGKNTVSAKIDRTISATIPSTVGTYRVYVKVYDSDENVVATRVSDYTVVDPIKLSATIENTGTADRELTVCFVINGVRISESKNEDPVSVAKGGTHTFTYDYYTKYVEDTTFYLESDTEGLGGDIVGLNKEYTFYKNKNNYTLIEVFVVVVFVFLVILAIFVYRKPIKNYGKPKARR